MFKGYFKSSLKGSLKTFLKRSLRPYFSPLALALFLCQAAHFSIMALCLSSLGLWLKTANITTAQLTTLISTEALMRPIGFAFALFLSLRGERRSLSVAVFMGGFCLAIIPFFLYNHAFIVLLVLVVLLFTPYWLISPFVETGALRVSAVVGVEVGRLVAFGTMVFGVALVVGGYFFERYSLEIFPPLLLVLFALQALALWLYRRVRGRSEQKNTETKNFLNKNKALLQEESISVQALAAASPPIIQKGSVFLRKPRWRFITVLKNNIVIAIAVLAASIIFGVSAAHAAYASILWADNGWGTTSIGVLWSMSLAGELIFFMLYKTSNKKINGLMALAFFTVLFTSLRWLGIGVFIEVYWVQFVIQLLHALSFSSMYLVVIELMARYAKKENLESWQSFFFLVAQGAMPAIVVGITGKLFQRYGVGYYYFLAAFTLLALPIVWLLHKKLQQKENA